MIDFCFSGEEIIKYAVFRKIESAAKSNKFRVVDENEPDLFSSFRPMILAKLTS